MIGSALLAAGGEKYLKRQAITNPTAFMSLLGRTLPKELTGKDGTPLVPLLPGSITVTVVRPKTLTKS